MDIPAYLINLDDSTTRLAHVTEQLNQAGIVFERVSAFDARGADLARIDGYDEPAARAQMGRPLRGGEIGCYKSHLICAQSFLDSGARYGLVFEDDIDLTDSAQAVILSAIAALQDNDLPWEIVHLGPDRLKIFSFAADLPDGHSLVAAHYFPMTTSALLWSRAGAARFVETLSRIEKPVDFALRDLFVRYGGGYAITPPLARQRGVDSDIDGTNPRRESGGRSWAYGFIKQRRLWTNKAIATVAKWRYPAASGGKRPNPRK